MTNTITTDWGRLAIEPGAFDGVPSRIRDNVAFYAVQGHWADGLQRPITRDQVLAQLNAMASRIKPVYHAWESDAKAEADAVRKALDSTKQ